MRKLLFVLSAAIMHAASSYATDIKEVHYAGPISVSSPYLTDSLSVKGKRFDMTARLLDMRMTAKRAMSGALTPLASIKGTSGYALHTMAFEVSTPSFTKAKISVDGIDDKKISIDDKDTGNDITLLPGSHTIVVKGVSKPGKPFAPKISITGGENSGMQLTDGRQRLYTLLDVICGTRYTGIATSPDGSYAIVGYRDTGADGKTRNFCRMLNVKSGTMTAMAGGTAQWTSQGHTYWYTVEGRNGRDIMATDAASGVTTTLASDIPDGMFSMTPDAKRLIYTTRESPQSEDKEVSQILTPQDRQPGMRSRATFSCYDIATGIMQPLTFGHHSMHIAQICSDSRHILLQSSEERLDTFPSERSSFLLMDIETMHVDTLLNDEGYISQCWYIPARRQVLMVGNPEAFNRTASVVRPEQPLSLYENELFLYDLRDGKVTALTKQFKPCVSSIHMVSGDDNTCFFRAADRNRVSLYAVNLTTGKITDTKAAEQVVEQVSRSSSSQQLLYYGQSDSNSQRLYAMDTKNCKSRLVEDLSARILDGVRLGKCEDWTFKNSRGDSILTTYYLPPFFDSSKKYPMIVNYYGGCTPTTRYLESRYPPHVYAAQGYVVLVIQPSGATGFGQEFSGRHANAWGDYTADDIIEGTQMFCKAHPYVNTSKIGCIGASYGGFMTQYLQTKTNLFAAAVSHAGISSITSYWGEGYWGYAYSQAATPRNYPWNATRLYTEHSPLYNADKINTPLLFVHGTADTNVPIGESIQMFTALKMLGKETALVTVKDQNHHILDFSKRMKWQNTIFAWFAKYLKDDGTWWNSLYPERNL